MNSLIWIALGGATGATVRFGLQSWFAKLTPDYPLGTTLANISGCLLAGMALRFLSDMSDMQRHLILTGFLGALTTFSSFSIEVVTLLEKQRFAAAAWHWSAGAFVCVGCSLLGYWLMLKTFPQL